MADMKRGGAQLAEAVKKAYERTSRWMPTNFRHSFPVQSAAGMTSSA